VLTPLPLDSLLLWHSPTLTDTALEEFKYTESHGQ